MDATVGSGGHAAVMAAYLGPKGILVGLDRDPSVLQGVGLRLESVAPRVELRHASYETLAWVLRDLDITSVDCVLMDLGVGSHQLDDPERGLSFRSDAPLDMRYDRTTGKTAGDLLRRTSKEELATWFHEFGEERYSRRIAAAIVERRKERRLPTSCGDLADLVVRAVSRGQGPKRGRRIHPATRVFQALRIVVNDELGVLDRGLVAAHEALHVGGRLAVISFHSLEDRRVKQFFRSRMRPVFKKPIQASASERHANPRSRSAKLRVAVRLPEGGTAASDPRLGCQEARS